MTPTSKLVFINGYQAGIAMVTMVAPALMRENDMTYERYQAIHTTVFPARSAGELMAMLDLYCEGHRQTPLLDALVIMSTDKHLERSK
jgi:hypothetical protein